MSRTHYRLAMRRIRSRRAGTRRRHVRLRRRPGCRAHGGPRGADLARLSEWVTPATGRRSSRHRRYRCSVAVRFGQFRSVLLRRHPLTGCPPRRPRRPSTAASADRSPTRAVPCCPASRVTDHQLERQTVDSGRHQRIWPLRQGAAAAGHLRGQGGAPSFKAAVVPKVQVSVDTQTPLDFKLEIGAAHRDRRGHRRIAAAQD